MSVLIGPNECKFEGVDEFVENSSAGSMRVEDNEKCHGDAIFCNSSELICLLICPQFSTDLGGRWILREINTVKFVGFADSRSGASGKRSFEYFFTVAGISPNYDAE